jgi:LacI family transcriptional regulator
MSHSTNADAEPGHPPHPPREPRVLIRVPLVTPFGRDVLAGINRYMHVHGPWRILLFSSSDSMIEVFRRYPEADGIIGTAWGKEAYGELVSLGKPAVLLTGRDDPPGLPRILDDDEGVCRAALEHLRQCGHERVAYFGWGTRYTVFNRRRDIFAAMATEAGLAVHTCMAGSEGNWSDLGARHDQEPATRAWLSSLPKPIGVFCPTGTMGRDVLDAAIDAGICVPEELAVVAVGYGDLLAESCSPPLTTVEENWEQGGYRAAQLLTRAMQGEDLTGLVEIQKADGVTVRGSSERLAIDDPVIAQAVRRVRQLACDGSSIEQMLQDIPVSRRKVEMGFRKYLGTTIREEVVRVRVQRARRMLRLTEMPVIDIGVRCGFNSRSRFYECFRQVAGQSPQEYRQTHRQ